MFSLLPNLITQRCSVPFPSLIELTFSEYSTHWHWKLANERMASKAWCRKPRSSRCQAGPQRRAVQTGGSGGLIAGTVSALPEQQGGCCAREGGPAQE